MDYKSSRKGRQRRRRRESRVLGLRIGEAWTVPAVELSRGRSKQYSWWPTSADVGGGKQSRAARVQLPRGGGRSVLLGRVEDLETRFPVCPAQVSAGRPSRGHSSEPDSRDRSRLHANRKYDPCRIAAVGRRAGIATLAAAAMEERASACRAAREPWFAPRSDRGKRLGGARLPSYSASGCSKSSTSVIWRCLPPRGRSRSKILPNACHRDGGTRLVVRTLERPA